MEDKYVSKYGTCSGDHCTSKRPKNASLTGEKAGGDKKLSGTSDSGAVFGESKQGGSKYRPPSMTVGKKLDGSSLPHPGESYRAIRITNLSDATTEIDLENLVKTFGPIEKNYLAKNKVTNVCKGFAYVHFKFRNDADKAISILDGCHYNHLILTVDWFKESHQFY